MNRRNWLRQVGIGAVTGMLPASSGASVAASEPAGFKFSICNETFRDWPFEKAFALAAECGYQGVEIAPFTIANDVTTVSSGKRREIRQQVEHVGLRVVGLHWLLSRTKGLHLTSPDAATRNRTTQYLSELARFCADLGGDILVFGSPQQRNLADGISRSDGMKFAAEVIEKTLPVLESTNVRLALEPLSPKTTNFLSTAADAVDLIESINSPRCRLILDCFAMSTESTAIPALLRQYQSHLIHFHANDPNRQGPGFGHLDFGPIFRTLREVHYQGWVSVEVFDYRPGAERLARDSIEYMQRKASASYL